MTRKVEWYELVSSEGADGSVFSADMYCGACTKQIKKELKAEGKAPEEGAEYFDSDDYPQDHDLENEESDSPQHCGSHEECLDAIVLPDGRKIGAWLGGSLTSDGVEYVCNTVKNDLYTADGRLKSSLSPSETRGSMGDRDENHVAELWAYLYKDQIEDCLPAELSVEEYTVVVDNIGTVLTTDDYTEAKKTFGEYIKQSKSGRGRAAGEAVHMFHGDEVAHEYFPEGAGDE